MDLSFLRANAMVLDHVIEASYRTGPAISEVIMVAEHV